MLATTAGNYRHVMIEIALKKERIEEGKERENIPACYRSHSLVHTLLRIHRMRSLRGGGFSRKWFTFRWYRAIEFESRKIINDVIKCLNEKIACLNSYVPRGAVALSSRLWRNI